MECVKASRSDTTHRKFFEKRLDEHIKSSFVSVSYSHHQKSIICDAPSSGDNPRRLVSFVGGLDLTNGRWDTPNHELFATITKYCSSVSYILVSMKLKLVKERHLFKMFNVVD